MAKVKLQPIRGMKDIFGYDMFLYDYIVEIAKELAHLYNFQQLSTPIMEKSEVFHRSLGETSDVVSKETYTFLDRDQSSVTLRPEFTAGIVRALISNSLSQKLPAKFFSHGPVFRHERPQKARYRQFHQINFEYFGANSFHSDVEIIALADDLLNKLKISSTVQLEINSLGDIESRNNFKTALLNYFIKYEAELSPDSKARLHKNPLRILDSKDENDKKIATDAPSIFAYFNDESKRYFDSVLDGLAKLGINYTKSNKLVRGLDYYAHTIFEFTTHDLGSQGTVLAGGRYNGLVELMGGDKVKAVGFAAGIERFTELIATRNQLRPKSEVISLITIGEEAEKQALNISRDLRKANIAIDCDFGKNIAKQFKRANDIGARKVIILGEDEIRERKFKLKDMESGFEEEHEYASLINAIKK